MQFDTVKKAQTRLVAGYHQTLSFINFLEAEIRNYDEGILVLAFVCLVVLILLWRVYAVRNSVTD
jgi:hypothetical protein